jgi:16S rRNA (guanine966-N2)-methyltransferase
LRIIGGKFKGRKLNAPELSGTRPTTDFARESLFNMLNSRGGLENMRILDLYSGTGAIAFECISRDAAHVTCVDLSTKALSFIKATAREWNCNILTVKSDVLKFLSRESSSYDLVFADPPFDYKYTDQIPGLVFAGQILKKDGVLIVEHGKESDLSGLPNFSEVRMSGRVHFSFFRRKE